jgi:hypothetical protein
VLNRQELLLTARGKKSKARADVAIHAPIVNHLHPDLPLPRRLDTTSLRSSPRDLTHVHDPASPAGAAIVEPCDRDRDRSSVT